MLGLRHQPHLLHGRGVGRQRALLRRRAHPRGRSGLGDARPSRRRARSEQIRDRPRRAGVGGGRVAPSRCWRRSSRDRGAAGGRSASRRRCRSCSPTRSARPRPRRGCGSGTPVTAGCRMIKDAHELALMRRASEITRARAPRGVRLAAGGHDPGRGRPACPPRPTAGWASAADRWCCSAPTPPSRTAPRSPRPLRAGDVVLIDGGGRLHGYASDITRTAVFGAAAHRAPAHDLGRRAPRPAGRLRGRAARAWRRRRWTPRRAAWSRRRASAPATATSPTASATASGWTATSGRTS